MEHALYNSWLQSWGPRNVDSVRRAHRMREEMHARREAVPGSDKSSAMDMVCGEAMEWPVLSAARSTRRVAITVAQPRTRSRSRSPRASGSGVEVLLLADDEVGGPVPMAPGGLSAMARSAKERYPDRDQSFWDPVFAARGGEVFQGAGSLAAEPDRRSVV